jgi:hypothetical protein
VRARLCALIGALVFLAGSASAFDGDRFQFSGFGTVGGTTVSERDLYLTRGGLNEPGGNYFDTGLDTLLALQGSFRIADNLDATVQLISIEDEKGNYTPQVSWAFLRYNLRPNLSIRLGRMRAPFFMLSDTLYVNYANPWVRPPGEVYELNPFNDLNGVDLLYRAETPIGSLELHPYYGSSSIDFQGNGGANLTQTHGINIALHSGALSLHAGHGGSNLELQWGDTGFLAISQGLLATGNGGRVSRLAGDDAFTRFDSLGFSWDDGELLVSGEYVKRRASRYVYSSHAWFLSAGYRIGPLTPFVMVARQTADEPMIKADLPPALEALNRGIRRFTASRNGAQHSQTAGLRWDLASNIAAKLQWTKSRVDDDAWGLFFPSSETSGTSPAGRSVQSVGISVDVVF